MLDPIRKSPTLHVAAVVGILTTLGGLAASPAFLAIVPAKWAAVITAAGALIQAFTRAIHDGTPKVES